MPIRPSHTAPVTGRLRSVLVLVGLSLAFTPDARSQTMPASPDTTGRQMLTAPTTADTTGQMASPMSSDTTGQMPMASPAMPMQPSALTMQPSLGGNTMGTGLATDSLDVDEFVRITTDSRIDLAAAMMRGSVSGGTPIAQPGVQMRLSIPSGWVASGRAFQSDSVTIVAYRSPQSAAVSEQYRVPPPVVALTQQARRMDRSMGQASSMNMANVSMSDSMRKAIEALSGLPNPQRANQPLPRDVPRLEVTASMTKAAHDSVRLWAVVQETLSFGPNQLPIEHQTLAPAQLSMLGLDQAYLARYRQSRGAYEVQLNALFGKRGDQQYVVMVENPAEVTLTPEEVNQVHQILASFRP